MRIKSYGKSKKCKTKYSMGHVSDERNSHKNKVMILTSYKKEGFATDNVDFLIKHGVKMPCKFNEMLYKTVYTIKIKGKRILGNRIYDSIKKLNSELTI